MKVLYLFHKGANGYYLENVVREMNLFPDISSSIVYFSRFKESMLEEDYDVLIYETFPDEYNPKKFNKETVDYFDNIFLKFKGVKILHDTHDDGNKDGYTRFDDITPYPPVIKAFTGKYYPKIDYVILNTSLSLSDAKVYRDEFDRDISISFKHGQIGVEYYPHYVRESVRKILKVNKDLPDVSYKRVEGRENYIQELRRTLISVGCCGFGQYSGSYADCLKAGALLYAHCSLEDIHFLPNEDLVDGEDYISWNSHNFHSKLKWLLDNPLLIDRVRKNGREKFKKSFSYDRSAIKLINYLKKEV